MDKIYQLVSINYPVSFTEFVFSLRALPVPLALLSFEFCFCRYDERSWYPLGRPVGTTIYPGLQILSATVHYLLNQYGWEISLNDVCVYQPAWFSILTCLFTFGITYEASRSTTAGLASAYIMAIVPAHIMRSVAGGYDNESIAIGAMCMTFYFWVRSLRNEKSGWIGALAALAYTFMVAAWGGYVFVLNMVGVHAMFLLVFFNYSPQLHLSYSLFYIFGTIGAMQFPVVGSAPIKSLEQLGPMFVFFCIQLRYISDMAYEKYFKEEKIDKLRIFQLKLFSAFIIILVVCVIMLAPTGWFGPVSSRIRGLFIQHTRTGNPLVDSVAEHQATHSSAYMKFFQDFCIISPLGLLSLLWNRNEAKYFVMIYALIAGYFSRKMNRLMLLLSPPMSILGGMVISGFFEWSMLQLHGLVFGPKKNITSGESDVKDVKVGIENLPKNKSTGKNKNSKKSFSEGIKSGLSSVYNSKVVMFIRFCILAPIILYVLRSRMLSFTDHSEKMAEMLSNPSIIVKANYQDGRVVYLDDFREAYWWIRDNTAPDARIMSWWDYGYQIAQISNRTTLADGNTWNHEHIALLGKILVSNVTKSHSIVRHLADYVLVWSTRFAGNPGDDIAKSPHMARIAGSVYKDINPQAFGMHSDGRPTKMMAESLVYNLVLGGLDPSIPPLPPKTYEEAYTSSHRMVRIYKIKRVSKDSKAYGKKNLGYEAWKKGKPGFEAYPPKLKNILAGKRDFEQLEDFNVKAKKKNKASSGKSSEL